MTGSYCLSKSHACHITSSLLQRVLRMSASNTNASAIFVCTVVISDYLVMYVTP